MRRPTVVAGAMLAVVLAGPLGLAADTHEPRVAQESYIAGWGDFFCFGSGFGCVRFPIQGGETSVHLAVDDDLTGPVTARVCAEECAASVVFCGEITIPVSTPGEDVAVSIAEAFGVSACGGLFTGGTKGVVTATFT